MARRGNAFRARHALVLLIAATGVIALAASPALAMRSKKIAPHLCKTVHGGRFVPIPGFPGERIDRRLLPDIRWMKRRFDIFITDGYSRDPIHAENGEHPIGLATDIVPNFAKGGTWNEIGNLAHLAEPTQDHPIMPWRWVGWNGDAGHGRGNHLHLSWSHSETAPGNPARVAYTRRCPGSGGDNHQGDDDHQRGHRHRHRSNGGTGGGGRVRGGGRGPTGGTGTGGGGASAPRVGKLAPVVPEDL
jgi:uncharacterized membrane protein YgcG